MLAVDEHVNPSLSALVVIDAETNSILYSKYGVGFTWTEEDADSLLYVKPAPHFSNISGSEKIYNVEDDELLETGENEQIVSFDIYETDNSIAYVVNDKKGKDIVYITDYNKKKEKLVTKDVIKMDKNQEHYNWNEEGQLIGTLNNEEQVIDGGK